MESVNVVIHAPAKEILKEVFATQPIANANVRKQKMLVRMAKNVIHGDKSARSALEEALVAQRIISVL